MPRLSSEWELDAPGALWHGLDATCCFVDISGFTALSERLARRGRIGAEELTEVLNHVFSRMLVVAYSKGGALLKFGGDALLLAFTQGDHAVLAAQAAVAMRATLREARTLPTSVGRVNLRMSVGLHTGNFCLFRAGTSHRELIIAGPDATATTRMEQIAEAGQIVISEATAARLPGSAVGARKEIGHLLRWTRPVEGGPGPIPAREVPPGSVELATPVALRPRSADRRGDSEHRRASVGFVKFQGVDDLLASEGPDATAEALHEVVTAVQRAADEESVTFLASDIDANGGKIILVSGVPTVREDDEGRLLRTARAILDSRLPLPVRVGANNGHVFACDIGTEYRRTFTIMGDTVNLAARLMAAAHPGELYVTGGLLDRSRTAFDSDALEPFMVKGKSHPVQAYRVGRALGPKSGTAGSLPFRGRREQHSSLVEMLKVAAEGRGRIVSIEGERGLGKSRLVSEFVATVGAPTVMFLEGEAYGASIPYFPLRRELRRLFEIEGSDRVEAGHQLTAWVRRRIPIFAPLAPLLGPLVDADLEHTSESAAIAPEFVRERVSAMLVAAIDSVCPTPLVLVAEDAHWFDETTSEICGRLAKAARERPWLVCAVRRPGEGGFAPAEPELQLRLGPLTDAAASELVESATDSAPLRPQEYEGLVSRAGGNPLFLEELLRIIRNTDLDALPDSLDAVAMRQIDSLPAQPRRVLLLASVLGRSFDPELLRQVLSPDEFQGVDPLVGLDEHVVPDGPKRVRFRHALLQEAAYQTLPFRTRLAMHRQVVEAIERGSTSPAKVAELLSLHSFAAQEWQRTWRYARLAAERATQAHAPAEAAVHLERAIEAHRHLGDHLVDDALASVLADLGSTLELLGEYDRADDAYRRALSGHGLAPRRKAELADRRAFIRSDCRGRPSAAIRQLRAVAGQLGKLNLGSEEQSWIRGLLLARESDVRWRQGRLSEASKCSSRAAEHAEASNNTRALALSLSVQAECLLSTGRSSEATQFGRVRELYESLGDHARVALTLNNLAAVEYYNSRWEAAASRFEEAADAFGKAGDVVNVAFAQLNLGDVWLNQGRWDEAVAILSAAKRTLEACDYRLMAALATMTLGRAKVFLGDVDAGIELLWSALSTLDEVAGPMERLEVRARLAEALIFAGDAGESRKVLARARELDSEGPMTSLLDRIELTLAVISGDSSFAASNLDAFLDRARSSGSDYEVVMLWALANGCGITGGQEESHSLIDRLGLRRLPLATPLRSTSVV